MEYFTTTMNLDECLNVARNEAHDTHLDRVCIVAFRDQQKEVIVITEDMGTRDAFVNSGKTEFKDYDWAIKFFTEAKNRNKIHVGDQSLLPKVS